MKRSDITVVIPAYNAEQYIKKCLDSVFIQKSKLTYNVICVDNASTDSTFDILENYRKYDNLQVIHLDKNIGSYGARQKGMDNVDGKYLLFLDSDDYLDENAFSVLEETLRKHGDLDAVLFQYSEFKNGTNEVYRIRDHFKYHDIVMSGEEAYVKNDIPTMPWNLIIKYEILKKNNIPFATSMPDDVDFVFRLYPFLKSMVLINKVLYNYRIIPTSTSRGVHAFIPYIEGYLEMMPRHLGYIHTFGNKEYWNKTFYKDYMNTIVFISKYKLINGKDKWLEQQITKLKDLLPNILKSCKNDDKYFNKLRRMKYSLDILLMVITFLLRMKKAISK